MNNNNFLKSLSKSLLDDVRKVMEAKSHTVPKTEKEKKLAALAEPKDKITHADVLKGRGVVKEAELDGVAKGSMEDEKHMCATKVFHKEWAEGTPIKTMHADPDENGLIEWYDVMFEHGIERVMTEDMEILQQESHMHSKKKMKEDVERIEELSTATLKSYRAKARADAYDADDVDDEPRYRKRAAGSNMAGKKLVKRGESLKTEEVEQEQIEEAMSSADRYASTHAATAGLLKSIGEHLAAHKKAATTFSSRLYDKKGPTWSHVADIDHLHGQLKDIHDRLAQQGEYASEMSTMRREDVDLSDDEKAVLEELNANFNEIVAEVEIKEAKRGRPAKNAPAGQDEEPAALGYQLRKAASINKPVHFMNGERKEVAPGHINKFNDHMAARKTSQDKAAFQTRAHKSHAEFVKAVSEPLPKASKDTGEIVKYR